MGISEYTLVETKKAVCLIRSCVGSGPVQVPLHRRNCLALMGQGWWATEEEEEERVKDLKR
jgi:hypothetical protein